MSDQATALNPHMWVKTHADYLYAFAIIRVNDDELAKDLVQETFLAALQRVHAFEGKSTERTWLTAILKNKVSDVYRKKSSGLKKDADVIQAEQQQQDFFDEHDGHWSVKHRPQPFGVEDHDPLQNKEFNSVLQQCMQKLPGLWLSVFTMKHMEDATSENICRELKISPNNFWVIIHRAKLNLRACLQKKLDLKFIAMNQLKKIQYNCHKATFLIEKRTMEPLTLFERIQLHIHLAGCSVCRTYQTQSHLIGQMVNQILYGKADARHLDEEYKKQMEDRIEKELKK